MKVFLLIFLTFLCLLTPAQTNLIFDDYFRDQTLRFDYYHTGDSKSEIFSPEKILLQGPWAGNPDRCLQTAELGSYRVRIVDLASNRTIYLKGYSTIFSEYQTTGPALEGISKTYHETILLPCPKKSFLLMIEKRDRQNILSPVYRITIDPSDYHINNETVNDPQGQIIIELKNGEPHHCVDLVILGEGYTNNDLAKFKQYLTYYTTLFFSVEPYKSRKNLFNITGILSPSAEHGTDEPRQGIYRNTRYNSSFNAFDIDRYCLVEDNKTIRDIAGQVPYDAILIMVNRSRYGGGGIYNWQTVFNTGVKSNDYVFLHEFAHGFAGLGDEYFTSPVAYEDFYTPGVEPLEPNVTALLDPSNVKWKQYLTPGIQVPTEWGKAKFDSLNRQISLINEERSQVISQLKKEGVKAETLFSTDKDYQERISKTNQELDDFITHHPLKDKVGVFEGANYTSKGLYRPTIMSLMHKFRENDYSFGAVNEHALIETIEYYTGR